FSAGSFVTTSDRKTGSAASGFAIAIRAIVACRNSPMVPYAAMVPARGATYTITIAGRTRSSLGTADAEMLVRRTMKSAPEPMKRKDYEKELRALQVELCVLQDWVKEKGLRVVVVFEGRDAAGKGGTIKAITERVSPRVFRVV